MSMKIIAYMETDFPEKFGLPRQSGLVPELTGRIVFEPEYRNKAALKGLEGFSHIWLLWQFEGVERETWSPTVRPPRLGGNERVGVFATRSPFRPNPIGMSCVKLERIEDTRDVGTVLVVSGVDLRDKTPIYDIKPYLAYVDSHPEAVDGFAADTKAYALWVDFPEELLKRLPPEKRSGAIGVLRQDPRPSYQQDADRVYGMAYAGYQIRFRVSGNQLTVIDTVGITGEK